MVLAPLLIALVLFAIMDSRSARSGARSSKEQSSGSGLKDSGGETAGGKDGGGDAAHAPAKDGGSGGSKSSGQAGAEGKNEDGKSSGQGSNVVNPVDPVQEISFTAASEDTNELQRSIPVQIDAVILGGEAGTQVWALFLPAEMAAHPRILFSKYEKVSLEPLSEHLHPAIDGPENRDDAADVSGWGKGFATDGLLHLRTELYSRRTSMFFPVMILPPCTLTRKAAPWRRLTRI